MTRKYTDASLGGSAHEPPKTKKTLLKSGFRGFGGKPAKGQEGRAMLRSKMARVVAFENGVLMLRNICAPFLNATDVRWQIFFFSDTICVRKNRFSLGKTGLLVSKWFQDETKNWSILE